MMPGCGGSGGVRWGLWCLPFVADGNGDSGVKDLFNTILLFTTALHVHGTHLLGDSTALLRGHRCETLRLEELDAVLLVAQV